MGGTGWSNPFPLELGGGPTVIEATYRMLTNAVGKGGTAPDDDTIVALWWQSLAKGIGCVATFDERAALQAFPDKATDLLPYYERLLLTDRDPAASEEERRIVAAARWTASAAFLVSEIEQDLQLIDSRFEVVLTTDDEATVTVFGRNFEDIAGAEPFGGGRKATLLPNYSTYFVLTALIDLGGAAPSAAEKRSILTALRHLSVVLPAWMAFQVVTGIGFNLDIDRLDYTALSP
jgi:hypothetical protein